MITLTFSVIGFYFVGQVTIVSGFSGIGSINEHTPGFVWRLQTEEGNATAIRPYEDEKIAVMEAGKAVARGRVPVLSGIAEFTSAFAIDMAREAARIGLDGVMVMPALVYSSKPHETAAHFRSVATATDWMIAA